MHQVISWEESEKNKHGGQGADEKYILLVSDCQEVYEENILLPIIQSFSTSKSSYLDFLHPKLQRNQTTITNHLGPTDS